ncbi:hypothetical protein DL93DRAFT_109858 [Clavulina sp. PMI_390]|nr:hypothetical protein DL93DRAFT_109858 [Clavulina sp. PMI_390]
MDQAPNEIIFRILKVLPYKSIVRARSVCKSWKAVIDEFAVLRYLIWLGITGQVDQAYRSASSITGGTPPSSASERLASLHQLEKAWSEASIARSDTIDVGSLDGDRLEPQARTGSIIQASVMSQWDETKANCALPMFLINSEAVDNGPTITTPKPISPGEKDVGLRDYMNNLLITLTSSEGTPITFEVRRLDQPDENHPLANSPTLTCDDGDEGWDGEKCRVGIQGRRFFFRRPQASSDDFLILIWDWVSGDLLAVRSRLP